MAVYVIESYVPLAQAGEHDAAMERLRSAAERLALRLAGGSPHHVHSFYVPADEVAFHLIEAESLDLALELARAAAITVDRVAEAAAGRDDPQHSGNSAG